MSRKDNPVNDRDQMWREWAGKAHNGDKAAYSSLLKDITPYIRSVLAPGLANEDWIDDITQEVLISIHKSLKTYSCDYSFKSWINSIINFRKTDFLRKHYRSRSNVTTTLENPEFIKEHVTESTVSGELKDIEKALDTLPEKHRRVFELMKIEGYTAKEVANEMDMSVSAVKVSVHRTTKKLQEMMN
jgi:RNA polymerase sigma-70 factor (ECF subfamily)